MLQNAAVASLAVGTPSELSAQTAHHTPETANSSYTEVQEISEKAQADQMVVSLLDTFSALDTQMSPEEFFDFCDKETKQIASQYGIVVSGWIDFAKLIDQHGYYFNISGAYNYNDPIIFSVDRAEELRPTDFTGVRDLFGSESDRQFHVLHIDNPDAFTLAQTDVFGNVLINHDRVRKAVAHYQTIIPPSWEQQPDQDYVVHESLENEAVHVMFAEQYPFLSQQSPGYVIQRDAVMLDGQYPTRQSAEEFLSTAGNVSSSLLGIINPINNTIVQLDWSDGTLGVNADTTSSGLNDQYLRIWQFTFQALSQIALQKTGKEFSVVYEEIVNAGHTSVDAFVSQLLVKIGEAGAEEFRTQFLIHAHEIKSELGQVEAALSVPQET